MNRLCKHVGLLLLAACLIGNLYADDSVFIGDGDISALKLYDSQGNRLDATSENASKIGEGWIIQNPDTPILIITPRGTINVYEGSLLVTGNLTSKQSDIYLVSGKATFNTYDMDSGILTVSTPVSRHRLEGDGEMLVITSENEESVTAFTGTVSSYNSLTGFTRTIRPFDKLFMQEQSARPQQIEIGYYLTYATYPDMMLARQIVQELSKPIIAPTPLAAKAKSSPLVIEQPQVEMPVVAPLAEPVSSLTVAMQKPFIPEQVQVISVDVQKIPVPEKVRTITSSILKAPSSRIVVTVRPMVPEIPSTVQASIAVQVPSIPSQLTVVSEKDQVVIVQQTSETQTLEVAIPLDVQPELTIASVSQVEQILDTTIPIEEKQSEELAEAIIGAQASDEQYLQLTNDAKQENVGQEKQEEPVIETPVTTTAPASITSSSLISSSDANRLQGSFGVTADYRFQFDGTNSNTLSHRLTIKPFYTKGPFSISLQSYVQTEDFSALTSNATPFPVSTLGRIGYMFSYFDQLRIGYSTSGFYLALDHNRSIVSDMTSFTAPQFGESSKLVLQSQIKTGPFTLITAFDDLYFTNLLANRAQFGSSILQYTSNGYPLSIAVGALAKVENNPSWTVNLYPLLSFRFPVINTRTTQFSAIMQAHGYLPVYPAIDTDQFIDTSLATFFPNYSLGVGFAVKRNQFTAKILASVNDGKNHTMLVNDFAYTAMDTSYSSAFEILTDIRYTGAKFETKAVWNVPFTGSFAIAKLSTGHNADYSQLSLGFKLDKLTFGLGLANLGLLETLQDVFSGSLALTDLFGGTYATSYLYAGYDFGTFSLSARAAYPASPAAYTIPVVSLSARIKLSKAF
jgi:hypothetical protein